MQISIMTLEICVLANLFLVKGDEIICPDINYFGGKIEEINF
jgi:hypothetical protein